MGGGCCRHCSYYGDSVAPSILDELRKLRVELVNTSATTGKAPSDAMGRHFVAVAGDAAVQRFVARDVDSRLSFREKMAVDEWVESGLRLHVMRDHPSHKNHPMAAGMWGCVLPCSVSLFTFFAPRHKVT